MQNNKRTLKDLSFAHQDTDASVLQLIDRCETNIGRALLLKQLNKTPNSYQALQEQQGVIRFWAKHLNYWPSEISNGTIVMLEKFYESSDTFSGQPGGLLNGKFFQKMFNRNEYHFTQFSLSHLSDFLKGCQQLVALLDQEIELPPLLQSHLGKMKRALAHRLSKDLISINKDSSFKEIAQLSYFARREMKINVQQLMEHFALLDVWRGLAKASIEHQWSFPEIVAQEALCFEAKGLYHPFLDKAVCYDIHFEAGKNFMILTGANMSGKTTLMRALGVAAILAHLGMGVPAKQMKLSYLHGVITNMHVEDNLMKGESFFLAEVKNMKQTAEAIAQPGAQLVLMDELFKGTNVHDAYECTKAIVEGLLNHPHHIFVLSTHLHEVARHFEKQAGLSFFCFHTQLEDDGSFRFDYQLKPGISDERIGYKILVREGIVDILKK